MPRHPFLALCLLVPVPTVAVIVGMILFPDSVLGRVLFALGKLWLLLMPLGWQRLVDRGGWSFSPVRHGGWAVGWWSGLSIAAVILGAWWLVGCHLVDVAAMRAQLTAVGFDDPGAYLALAAYWIVINSVLEEYVWRWFVVRQAEALLPGPLAVAFAAIAFTLHHVVALSLYLPPLAVVVAGCGICIGGAWWSWMYHRYRSIWPGWLSHLWVDVAVFGLGFWLLFG